VGRVDAHPQGASGSASSVRVKTTRRVRRRWRPRRQPGAAYRGRRHVIRGESSRNDAESQALYAATLELLRPLTAACAFHAKHMSSTRAHFSLVREGSQLHRHAPEDDPGSAPRNKLRFLAGESRLLGRTALPLSTPAGPRLRGLGGCARIALMRTEEAAVVTLVRARREAAWPPPLRHGRRVATGYGELANPPQSGALSAAGTA
jgi:hypothetical protein